MSTSSRTMTPASFGLPLFLRTCLKNGATDALLTCVILLRHTRHGALFNKGEAMTVWLTRRGRVSASNQVNWRSADDVVNRKPVARQIFRSRAPDSFNWANRHACRRPHTRTLIPEPHLTSTARNSETKSLLPTQQRPGVASRALENDMNHIPHCNLRGVSCVGLVSWIDAQNSKAASDHSWTQPRE